MSIYIEHPNSLGYDKNHLTRCREEELPQVPAYIAKLFAREETIGLTRAEAAKVTRWLARMWPKATAAKVAAVQRNGGARCA